MTFLPNFKLLKSEKTIILLSAIQCDAVICVSSSH